MAEHMVRTQIYLPKATYQALQERGQAQGLTMADQVRAALDEYLKRSEGEEEGHILQPDDPLFSMLGMFDSGGSDAGMNHDYYLYGMPKRESAPEHALRETPAPARKPRSRLMPRAKKRS
jgi:hypothetical protein